jgi:tetratricopeptide (TPR) repeat protein
MNKQPILLSLLLLARLFPAEAETIVPPQDQVSEFEARRELSRVLRALGKTEAAETETRKLLASRPDDPNLLADLADLEATRGHYSRSRELYEQALSRGLKETDLRYARQALSWGDFYRSERDFRAYLERHLLDVDARLDLARVLIAEQRYEEAEQEYRALAQRSATRTRALIGLANCKLLERDYKAALPLAAQVLRSDPGQIEALTIQAEGFRALRNYKEAGATYHRLTTLKEGSQTGWIGLGRIARAQKDEVGAESCFRHAQGLNPHNVACRYYSMAKDAAGNADSLERLMAWHRCSVPELDTLAGLCASDGYLQAAITIYGTVLARDPEYFPARIKLAEVLSTAHRYDESIELLKRLRSEFPDNAKIVLSLARVLSWSRRYDDSLQTYRELISLNPPDPVPRKEMARAASWNKHMTLARATYEGMLTPPVDELLIRALQRSSQTYALRAIETAGSPKFSRLELPSALEPVNSESLQRRWVTSNQQKPYELYERASQLLGSGQMPDSSRSAVEAALNDLWPTYQLQKEIWLESRAKWLAWNNKFIQSENAYKQLVAFQPGNEEARFDLAQVEAAQNLSSETTGAYRQLLELDPLHTLAAEALERQSLSQNPAIFTQYTYWNEKGIGRASDIERHHVRSGAEFVWNSQSQFFFSGDYWLERPGSGTSASAAGGTLGVRTVFNEYLRASGEWSHKEYFDSRHNSTDTGNANVTFDAWDYVHLTAQYARLDELHNKFGLAQGVQSDNLSLLFDSPVNHYIDITGGATWTHYTDDNSGIWLTVAPSFILHDHPYTVKLLLRGDYRDTSKQSIFENEGARLRNIIHPYWTPQDYARGTAILEWRHDFSREFYAGAQQHYYALHVGVGIDSTGNNNYLVEAEWHYEFLKHWTVEARGGVDRSPAWDGASAFLSVTYRF